MPVNYSRTNKGKAEGYIRRNAHKWLTVDSIAADTELPRRAIRDALEELLINNVLQKQGDRRTAKYRFTNWQLERNGWVFEGKDLVYPDV